MTVTYEVVTWAEAEVTHAEPADEQGGQPDEPEESE